MKHHDFSSERMNIRLIKREHAALIHPLFQDPALFTYLPEDPPHLDKLEERYAFWESRESPDQSEYWLNYIVQLSESGEPIGTLQAGVHREKREASIAYMIATPFQGRGLGSEATAAMVHHLIASYQVRCVKAWIDTRNMASIRLVEKLGMTRSEFLKDADHFKGQSSDEWVYQMEVK